MRRRGVVAALALALGALVVPASAADASRSFQFRPVISTLPSLTASAATATTAPVDLPAVRAAIAGCDDATVERAPFVPTTRATATQAAQCSVLAERPGGARAPRYYLGPVALDSRAVGRARAAFVSGAGWTVRLTMTKAGSAAWDRLAQQQFHHQVAMVLDGLVQAAPTIQPDQITFTSFGGTAVISGSFTPRQARAIASAIRSANGG